MTPPPPPWCAGGVLVTHSHGRAVTLPCNGLSLTVSAGCCMCGGGAVGLLNWPHPALLAVLICLPLQEITGVTDEQQSRYILAAFQWSLEAAVQDTLNEQEAQRSRPPPQLVEHPQLRRRYPPQMMHQGFMPPPIQIVTRVVARRPPMVSVFIVYGHSV